MTEVHGFSLQDMLESPCDASGAREFLLFTAGRKRFGVDKDIVEEIRAYENVVPIPGAPEFVKGVIELDQALVPVVDMRLRFNLGEPVYDASTVIIVLKPRDFLVGMVVDSACGTVSAARH